LPLERRKVEVDFTGGDLTSDAGLVLFREVDNKLGLSRQLDKVLDDPRCSGRVLHPQIDLPRQRLFALAAGYEDLNDHTLLNLDTALQTASSVLRDLASAPTLCRLEQRADEASAWAMHEVLMQQFIGGFKTAPKERVLDFDATNDPVCGEQVGRYFNAPAVLKCLVTRSRSTQVIASFDHQLRRLSLTSSPTVPVPGVVRRDA
jgi:hypothetical protein